MNDTTGGRPGPRPERVRVTGPPRRVPPRAQPADIDADSHLGEVYLRSLLREQLWLAGRVLLVLALGLGTLPVLFHLAPRLSGVHLLGVPLPWLLLGVAVYPLLALLGWYYVRRAERNEQHFADLLDGSGR